MSSGTPKTYFISGASRSLGLGYARTLLATQTGSRIIAGVRNPANASQLHALAAEPANKDRIHVVPWDVDDESKVKETATKLAQEDDWVRSAGIDAVIVNAGVFEGGHKPPSIENLRDNFCTNVEGAIHTVQHLLPLLKQGNAKQIFFISSICGSMQGFYSETAAGVTYSMSKAAVNMLGIKYARELADEGFTVVLLHPGYVKSDMNKFDGGGNITVEEAVTKATKNVFLAAKPEWNGKFVDYEGETVPW
ncbi:hypothetical protein JCM8202v2_004321 [Rhodotorula sphaerocarpa]